MSKAACKIRINNAYGNFVHNELGINPELAFLDTKLDFIEIKREKAKRKAQRLIRDLEGGYHPITGI